MLVSHDAAHMFSLAGIASSFMVTEENQLFDTDLSGPPFFF